MRDEGGGGGGGGGGCGGEVVVSLVKTVEAAAAAVAVVVRCGKSIKTREKKGNGQDSLGRNSREYTEYTAGRGQRYNKRGKHY